MSRKPITGSIIYDALRAFEYTDYGIAPAAVTTYTFTVPLTYADGQIPQSADVRQSTAFLDSLGRVIQRRDRLGGTSTGDQMAHITQNLSGYLVSGVVIYDGAGRPRASIDPFYSANAGYVDYRTYAVDNLHSGDPGGLSSALHVTLRSFDAQGREVCSSYQFMPSSSRIPEPGVCRSSFDESSSYVRAVAKSYRGTTVNGINYAAVKVIPPENNRSSTPDGRFPNGPESFLDAAGRLRWTADVDGNSSTVLYDLLGQVTGVVRDVSDRSRPSIITSASYDMMGRLKQRSDPNIGTRTLRYDDQGRLEYIQLPERDVGNGLRARDEIRFGYDLGRPSTFDHCSASSVLSGGTPVVQHGCVRDSTLVYDTPYRSDPIYEYVAGRVSYAANGLTTIAYGYSPEGVAVRRDQAIAGLSGTFTSGGAFFLDGGRAHSDFISPYGSFSYDLYYDSMRRPVQVASGTNAFWSAPAPLTTGAYDADGRVAAVDLDDNLVHAASQYLPYSGLESAARVSTGATDLFYVTQETYLGRMLSSYRDEVNKTSYGYWYSDAGRLKASKATPFGTSALSQNSLVCASFNVSKRYGPGPSFGNLERVRDQVPVPASVETYNYGGTGIEGASPPGPDAVSSLASSSFTNPILYDALGRISSKGLGTEQFEYDLVNRLTRVTRSSGEGEVLSYDPTGKLLGRMVGSTVTYYLAGQATMSAMALPGCTGPGCTVDSSTVKVDVHVLLGRRLASVRALPASTGRVLYYHRDRLDSVVATSLGGGVVGASYRYATFGDLEQAQGETADSASEIGFTGALRLTGGLLVMGARVYDPKLRQFLQPDPLEPFTYTYVNGDPVNGIDPSGMQATTIQCDGDCSGGGPIDAGMGESIVVTGSRLPESARAGTGESITVTGSRSPGSGPGFNSASDSLTSGGLSGSGWGNGGGVGSGGKAGDRSNRRGLNRSVVLPLFGSRTFDAGVAGLFIVFGFELAKLSAVELIGLAALAPMAAYTGAWFLVTGLAIMAVGATLATITAHDAISGTNTTLVSPRRRRRRIHRITRIRTARRARDGQTLDGPVFA